MKRICPLCNRTYEVWQKVALKTGTVPTCKRCGVPLVPLDFQEYRKDENLPFRGDAVRCPQCGLEQMPAEKCAACGTALSGEREPRDEQAESPLSLFIRPGNAQKAGKTLGYGAAIGLLLIMIFSAGTFFIGLIYSEPYKAAKAFIRENQQIRRVVGKDLSFGFLPTGTVRKGPDTGHASFTIKVKGSTGSTNVTIELRKTRSGWEVISASCEDRDGRPMRLVRRAGPAETAKNNAFRPNDSGHGAGMDHDPSRRLSGRAVVGSGNQAQSFLSGSLPRVAIFPPPVSTA